MTTTEETEEGEKGLHPEEDIEITQITTMTTITIEEGIEDGVNVLLQEEEADMITVTMTMTEVHHQEDGEIAPLHHPPEETGEEIALPHQEIEIFPHTMIRIVNKKSQHISQRWHNCTSTNLITNVRKHHGAPLHMIIFLQFFCLSCSSLDSTYFIC